MSDFNSSTALWSTVVIMHSTSGSHVQSLFNAGDECFGIFEKRGKQSIAKYTVRDNEWQEVIDIPPFYQLNSYGITADRDHVYIVGGMDGWNVRDTILAYDINTGTQCGSGKMSSRRRACSCAILDNVLYVGAGRDEKHSFKSIECISLPDYCSHHRVEDTPTYKCSLASLCGRLVVSGGTVEEYSPASNMVSVLTPSRNTWLPLPPLNQQRCSHCTCTVGGDTLIVVGGRMGGITVNNTEVLKL